MTNNFSKKPHFPYTYGDQDADLVKPSDCVVELMKNEQFQNYILVVAFLVLVALGHYTLPSSEIPPELGESTKNIIEKIVKIYRIIKRIK